MDKKTNEWVLNELKVEPGDQLLNTIRRLEHFGHITTSDEGFSNDMLTGKAMPQTMRKRGRQKRTWIECTKEDAGGSVIKAMTVAQDRKRFRRLVWAQTSVSST